VEKSKSVLPLKRLMPTNLIPSLHNNPHLHLRIKNANGQLYRTRLPLNPHPLLSRLLNFCLRRHLGERLSGLVIITLGDPGELMCRDRKLLQVLDVLDLARSLRIVSDGMEKNKVVMIRYGIK
jgi:hypothetical protein